MFRRTILRRLNELLMVLLLADVVVAAEMQYPLDVASDGNRTIFIADRKLPGVWQFSGDELDVYFEGSKQAGKVLNAIRCVEFERQGQVLVGDSATREVYRLSDNGPVPLTGGKIGIPVAIAVDSTGTIYTADLETHRVWRIKSKGGEPEELAVVQAPRGLCVDSQDRLFVLTQTPNQILRLNADGESTVVVEGMPFQFPNSIVVDPEGTLYVSDGYQKCIWKIQAEGAPQMWVKSDRFLRPAGLAIHGDLVLVVDPAAKVVWKITPDGDVTQL